MKNVLYLFERNLVEPLLSKMKLINCISQVFYDCCKQELTSTNFIQHDRHSGNTFSPLGYDMWTEQSIVLQVSKGKGYLFFSGIPNLSFISTYGAGIFIPCEKEGRK